MKDSIKALDPEAKVFSRACPMFVPLVEEGWTEGEIACVEVADGGEGHLAAREDAS